MAVNISFKLRDAQKDVPPSKQKETPVLMMVNFGHSEKGIDGKSRYVPLKYATGEKIKPAYWNGKRARQTSSFTYQNFNTRLNNLEGYAKTAIHELINEKEPLTPESLKKRIDEKNPAIKIEQPKARDLNGYIHQFITDIESGERLSSTKEKYAYSTVKNFKGFKAQFDLYQKQKKKKLDFDQITIDFYNDYVKFFVTKNYSPNTIGRHVKNLKTIMHSAANDGFHKNLEFDRKTFKTISEEVDNIYLTENEIRQMFSLDLTENKVLEVARDVFLIGCFTAQRFSDYSRIRKDNIELTDDGNKIIHIKQMKTKEDVFIPIKPELAELLEKYDWTVPKIWEQKLNLNIKKVGKLAGIKDKVLTQSIKGGMKVSKEVFKHELIKTHTARRTGCTNMYLSGIPTIDIMKISGHKTEREFLNYIKVTKKETANKLVSHPYFASSTMRVAK